MVDLDHLHSVLEGKSQLLIIPHNDPDPDAIASAVGLRYLVAGRYGIKAQIGYCGIIGRAENKALVRYLDHPLQKLDLHGIRQGNAFALVDTHPGAGNNPLPEDIPATIVIDHHAWQDISATAYCADVQPEIEATATILITAIQAARLYDDDLIISFIGSLYYPNLGAEIADLLLRLQDVKWVICMGVFRGDLILSIRSRDQQIGACKLVQGVIGDLGNKGRHGSMAGGQIRLHKQDPSQLSDQLSKKALEYIKGDASLVGKPLI